MRHRRRLARFTLIVGMALALAACSATAATESLLARDKVYFAQVAEQAQANGASATQIAVLAEAARDGVLEPEAVTQLLGPYFDCLESFGARGEIDGTIEVGPGVHIPDFVVVFPEDVQTAADVERVAPLHIACEEEHMAYAWRALQSSPSAVEAWDRDFERRRPAILECIRNSGAAIDDSATIDELVAAATDVLASTGARCMSAG